VTADEDDEDDDAAPDDDGVTSCFVGRLSGLNFPAWVGEFFGGIIGFLDICVSGSTLYLS
jgi:hypothetical protein